MTLNLINRPSGGRAEMRMINVLPVCDVIMRGNPAENGRPDVSGASSESFATVGLPEKNSRPAVSGQQFAIHGKPAENSFRRTSVIRNS